MASDARIDTAGAALKGVFGDPGWLKKCALGALINMIPYVGLVWVMGYGLHYQRAVALGGGKELPEWKHFEPQIKTGFYAIVVGLVYSLPLSLVTSAVAVVAVSAALVGVAATEELAWLLAAGAIGFVAFMLLSVLYGIVLWPVYAHVELHDTIGSGFEFAEILSRVRANKTAFWTAARRAIALGLLSTGIAVVSMAVGFGLAALVAFNVLPEELFGLASLVMTPIQLVLGVVVGLVSVPIAFASNRLWGQYARIAYDLAPAGGAATVEA